MKTYPYTTDDGIIELVRKDEHDAVVAELEREVAENTDLRQRLHDRAVELNKLRADNAELLARLEERTQSHLHASARDVQTIQRQSVLLDRLATALDALIHDCKAHAKDIIKIRWGYDGDGGSKLSAKQIEECCDAASTVLAAYESTKSGNLPDTLAEAVKRMEAVTDGAIEAAYWDTGSWTRNVRACLIQAAKGESV